MGIETNELGVFRPEPKLASAPAAPAPLLEPRLPYTLPGGDGCKLSCVDAKGRRAEGERSTH